MKTVQFMQGLRQLPPGAALSIGNFDGLHLGHQQLLAELRRLRDNRSASASVVVTFEPHPFHLLRPDAVPPRLTPRSQKHELLQSARVDVLVEIEPTREVLDLTAEQFWAMI